MKSGISIVGEQAANFKRGGSRRGKFAVCKACGQAAKQIGRWQASRQAGRVAGKRAGRRKVGKKVRN